jgi:putative glycosyltransferase (TIGR04372 family)
LCITTFTGPDIVSDSYRRPLLALNFPTLQQIFSWSDAMHVPKTLIWNESGIPLNVGELFDVNEEYYERIGIKIVDLTPDEILAAVQERWQRLKGTWVDTEEDLLCNRRFWEILKANPKFYLGNNWIHPEARAGAAWLRSKTDEFLN